MVPGLLCRRNSGWLTLGWQSHTMSRSWLRLSMTSFPAHCICMAGPWLIHQRALLPKKRNYWTHRELLWGNTNTGGNMTRCSRPSLRASVVSSPAAKCQNPSRKSLASSDQERRQRMTQSNIKASQHWTWSVADSELQSTQVSSACCQDYP